MATYRLNQLKSKHKDLLEESVISKELMDTVLLKIQNSIKNLEYEESRLEFNKKIMRIVLLADKFNQILIHFNLMLEELVINQVDKFEQGLNTTNDINFFDQEKKDDNNIRKDAENVEKSANSFRESKKKDVKKSNSISEIKLSCNEELMCQKPTTFVSENFCEPFENIPEKILVKSNSDMKICHNPALFASEIVLKAEKMITNTIPEIKEDIVGGTSNKINEKPKTFLRSNHIDYKPTINSIRKHEVESKDANDQELSYRKVLDYLQKQPERAISPQSKKKIAINLGAPELVESKFHTSKKIKELQKSKIYSDIVSFNKLEIIDLNKKQLKMPLTQTVEESKKFKDFDLEIIKKSVSKNEKNNIITSKEYSNFNNEQNSMAKINKKFGQDQTDFEIIAKNGTSDVITEKLVDKCKVTVQNGDRCIVTHINSPDCFFIITASESIIDYDRFHEMLQQYCESDKSKKFLSKTKMMTFESNYFCCYNEVEDYNCTWFRCIVTDWLMNNSEKEDVVKVFAVDDGFEKEISLDQLRVYPHTIFSMPRMAIKCRLRDVYPPNSSKENILVEWPDNCIQFFHDLVRDSRKNPFTVTDIKKIDDLYEVNLRNPRGVSVSKAMIHTDHGVLFEKDELLLEKEKNILVKSDFMRQQILKAQGWYSNDDLDWENMDDIEENLTQAVANAVEGGYIPKDSRRLCRFTKIDGQPCFKGERCRFEHKLPDPDGWTADKEIAYTETINKLQMPEVKSKIKLLVTSVRSVHRFFAHFKLSPEKRKVLLSQNIVFTATQFSKYINKPEQLKTLRKLRTLPALGQLVLAKSSADGRWYRARVIMINTEDEFEVLFIDYGDRSIVPFNSLREIRREHLNMPQQAIECRIANIDPLDIFDKEMSTKSAEEVSSLILDKILTAEVTDNGYPLEVLLFENNVNIGEYLIKLNIATERSSRFIVNSTQVEC